MTSKSPEEKIRDELRLKFRLDEAARKAARIDEAVRIQIARDEGIREGKARVEARGVEKGIRIGQILGRIMLLQELLGLSQLTSDELSTYDESQLTATAEELRNQFRDRSQ